MRAAVALALVIVAGCSEDRVLGGACPDCGPSVHPAGILDPASDQFHGKELARRGWDFGVCQSCHGDDFSGGTADASCVTCHTNGPTTCETCHRTDNETAAHALHRGAELDCSECHTKPAVWDAPGHILDDMPPAEVTFGPRAARAGSTPSWDGQRCSNVYCHGNAQPRWDDTPVGGCDRCHGAPPPSHERDDCATCHPSGAHIDGVVQVGRTNDCSGCHGSAASAAPPVDLAGNVFTTALGVGAHQAHLQGPHLLRQPIACETCHTIPLTLTAAGHLDPAPADVAAALQWNRATQTCTTYCHGPTPSPAWTTEGTAACGTCHGVPPSDANHTPAMALSTCADCHARTVNGFGNILVTGGQHIDGDVDGN